MTATGRKKIEEEEKEGTLMLNTINNDSHNKPEHKHEHEQQQKSME